MPVAESGYTTSEFVGKTIIQVLTLVLSLFAVIGHGLSVAQQESILTAAATVITVLETAYIAARNYRKQPTTTTVKTTSATPPTP